MRPLLALVKWFKMTAQFTNITMFSNVNVMWIKSKTKVKKKPIVNKVAPYRPCLFQKMA